MYARKTGLDHRLGQLPVPGITTGNYWLCGPAARGEIQVIQLADRTVSLVERDRNRGGPTAPRLIDSGKYLPQQPETLSA